MTIGEKILSGGRYLRAAQVANDNAEIMLTPTYRDMGLIPQLYAVFCRVCPERYIEPKRRFLFSFIALMLYSPGSFYKSRTTDYLCFEIATAVGYHSQTTVSKSKNLFERYELYPDFKSDVDYIIEEMIKDVPPV